MSQSIAIQTAGGAWQVGRWLVLLTLVAVSGAFGGVAAAHLAPWTGVSAFTDLLTPFVLHFGVVGIAAVVALRFKRHELGILVGGVALACFGHAAVFHLKAASQASTIGDTSGLRIYGHNVWDAHPDIPTLEAALLASDADVLALSEVDPTKMAMLKRLSVSYPYVVSCAHRYECAMAILSRVPIIGGSTDRIRYDVPPFAIARIDGSSRGVGVFTIIATHVHRPTRNPMIHRRQMQALVQLVQQQQGPVVLAGDLNTSRWGASYRLLTQSTGLQPTMSLLPTWPVRPFIAPQFELDHMLVSRHIAVGRTGVGPLTGSDHAPLMIEIRSTSSNATP